MADILPVEGINGMWVRCIGIGTWQDGRY